MPPALAIAPAKHLRVPPPPDQSARDRGAVQSLGGSRRLVRARHGLMLVNANDVYIGRSLREYGEWSEGEVKLFTQILRPGHIAVEVGANIGAHTIALARPVGPAGLILAFEPQPRMFRMLCANLALNEINNVDCRMLGLGAAADVVRVDEIDDAQAGNFGGFSLRGREGHLAVTIARLDDIFDLPSLQLLKIDVEGMEADVLQGAVATIQRCRPFLYLENDRADQSERLIRLVWSLDYDLYWHVVPLFNGDNFFGSTTDIFGAVSLNMLGVPRERPVKLPDWGKITDAARHPLRDRASA